MQCPAERPYSGRIYDRLCLYSSGWGDDGNLERYNDLVRRGKTTEAALFTKELEESIYAMEKEDRQYLVNYLVHLEGIATLVNTGVLRLSTINDLMAYRYEGFNS